MSATIEKPRGPQLVQRFQERIERHEKLKKLAAEDEKLTKKHQVDAEVGKVLPPAGIDGSDTEARGSMVLNDRLPDTTIDEQQRPDVRSHNEDPRTVAQLEVELNHAKDLYTGHQADLEDAAARIQDLEEQLKNTKAQLKESILEDQSEEILKQKRIVENLQRQLEEVESERDHLRKQFRESEATVWTLESEVRRLQHREQLGRDQQAVGQLSQVHGDVVTSRLDGVKGPQKQIKAEQTRKKTINTKKWSPMIERRRGDFALYFGT